MGNGKSRNNNSKSEPGAKVTASVEVCKPSEPKAVAEPTSIPTSTPVSTPTTNNTPTSNVTVKAWVGVDGGQPFPELDDAEFALPTLSTDKAPLAICISGGGFRAATLGLGWLRGLHKIGVLQRAQYLVTCSGSSWVSSALCFQQVTDTAEFLGPYLPPESCTLEALKQVGEKGRSAAAGLADAAPVYDIAKDLLSWSFGDDDGDREKARTWSKAIAAAFLEPFDLAELDASTTTCTGTKGAVHESLAQRAAAAGRGTVYSASVQELPYPIICQCLMLPRDRVVYYPFEWTPLYGGCPVTCANTEPKLGCGWVETLGLNAALVDKPTAEQLTTCAAGQTCSLTVRPAGPASLGEAIGISSAYNSYKWALGKTKLGEMAHKALGFNTASYFDLQEWACNQVALADGGGTDYHAIYPALRRQVPNILVLSATRTHIEGFDKFAKYMKDMASLFGAWPGDPEDTKGLPVADFNAQRQVFALEGFAELHAGLMAQMQAGGPPVYMGEYEVLENKAQGVSGGWSVRVLWVVNDLQPQWEAALPEDTKERLRSDREGVVAKVVEAINPLDADTLRTFPHVSTFSMDYTPELVSLMANHAAYMVVRSAVAVQRMLG